VPPPYSVPADARALMPALDTNLMSDAALVVLSTNHTGPLLDDLLRGVGAPFAATYPALLVHMDATLVVALAFDAAFWQTGGESAWSKAKREYVYDLIRKINEGTLNIGGLVSVSGVEASELNADRPSAETFVGDETQWTVATESRQ